MSALGDIIVAALKRLLKTLVSPLGGLIEKYGNSLIGIIVDTPHPDAVFSRPTNPPWPGIYDYYWDVLVPLALFLWAASIGVVIFLESTSHLFGSFHRSKLKRRAFSGLLGILSWWWLAAISLRFVEALTGYIVPDLSEVTLFQTLSFGSIGVLGLVVTLLTDFILFVLIALIYFTRQLVLYLFVLLMPILMVLWIPGVGPFALMSRFVRRLAGFYLPFLFMTVPVAVLFRLGHLLGSEFEISMAGFGAWLTALVIPIAAVLSPIVLVWQAGALFFAADRAARHVSTDRARGRVMKIHESGGTTVHGSRNFVRGARGDPAMQPDGQYLLNSGGSRAHATGARLRSTGSRLGGSLAPGTRGEGGGGSDGRRGGGGASGLRESSTGGREPDRSPRTSRRGDETTEHSRGRSRADDFDHLRERRRRGFASDRSSPSSAAPDEDYRDDTDDDSTEAR